MFISKFKATLIEKVVPTKVTVVAHFSAVDGTVQYVPGPIQQRAERFEVFEIVASTRVGVPLLHDVIEINESVFLASGPSIDAAELLHQYYRTEEEISPEGLQMLLTQLKTNTLLVDEDSV